MKSSGGNGGFTLIELLAAAALAAFFAAVGLAVVSGALRVWHRSIGASSTQATAQVALARLTDDLQTAFHRHDGNRWLVANIRDDSAVLRDVHGWDTVTAAGGSFKPSGPISLAAIPDPDSRGIAEARFGLGGLWLRLVHCSSAGEPEIVSYQIVRRTLAVPGPPADSTRRHYVFCRSTSTEVLARGYDLPAAYDDTLANPASTDILADNIVDFGAWLYVRDPAAPSGLRQVFPTSPSDLTTFSAGRHDGVVVPFPDVADVMIRVLSDEGADLIAGVERGRVAPGPAAAEAWWNFATTHSSFYVTRIEIAASGL